MHLRGIFTCEDMAHDAKSLIMDVHKVFSPQKARTTLSVSVNRLAARTCAAPGMTQSTLRKNLYKC